MPPLHHTCPPPDRILDTRLGAVMIAILLSCVIWIPSDKVNLKNLITTYYIIYSFIAGTGVTTYSLHPGAIQTELQQHVFGPFIRNVVNFLSYPVWKDIIHGAQTTICCAVDANLAQVTGKYYRFVSFWISAKEMWVRRSDVLIKVMSVRQVIRKDYFDSL